MTRNRLVLIGLVAMALAAFVSMSIYRVLNGAATASRANALTTVVAAANDVAPGTKLNGGDLRLIRMPRNDVPPGSFAAVNDVVGRAAIVPLMKGAPVVAGQLAAANAGAGLPALIPAGMRAVSVKVNDVISVAGFVTGGSRVDVLVTGQPGQANNNDPATTTVLENVQVLAAGQKLHSTPGDSQQTSVITLLVTPEQAQKLALSTQEGKIQLSLRNPLDEDGVNVSAIHNSQLYSTSRAAAPVSTRKDRTTQARVAKPIAAVPPEPYTVELIRGEKRDIAKFEQQKDAD